jgi:hypothetical protein
MVFGGTRLASAQLGECTDQVLSAPTESSVRVHLTGVNDWPVNPICFWFSSGIRSDGNTYEWRAGFIGDGLVEGDPSYVNVAMALRYDIRSPEGALVASRTLLLNLFCPYPSEGFIIPIVGDQNPANRVPPEGSLASWGEPVLGDPTGIPSLSYRGSVTLAANKLTVDIVFTGGTVITTVGDLIAMVNNSSLTPQVKHALLVTLNAASSATDCEVVINKLQAFQNKVLAQVLDAPLAASLVAAAQEVIDAACE